MDGAPFDGASALAGGAWEGSVSGAEEVRLLEPEYRLVFAAAAGNGDLRRQGPDVPGTYIDIEFAVAVHDGRNECVVQVFVLAEDALRLGSETGVETVAFAEQQL